MRTKLIILAIGAALLLPFVASAQSRNELEAAKSLAKTYGYSEAEIEAILAAQAGEKEGATTGEDNALSSKLPQSATVLKSPVSQEEETITKSRIYGHDFFASKGLSVIPSINTPAPVGYVLGPGDDITIDIWGNTNAKINATVGKDGTILINGIGPVTVGGLTAKKAESSLKNKLSKIYGDIGGATKIKLTINRVRSVTVNVVGDVMVPGAYSLPALAQIPSALYMAGGVEETASIRDVRLYREGKLIGSFDFYEFMFKGVYDPSLKIEDNDIISVPSYRALVTVEGEAKRPMLYEVKDGDSLEDILTFAGGFSDDADKDAVYVERKTASGIESHLVSADSFASFAISNGDMIHLNAYQHDPLNRVIVGGAVAKPGYYSINETTDDVKSLIEQAGGLLEGASKDRATIFRKDSDMLSTSINFNISEVLAGRKVIALQREDSLHIYEAVALQDSLKVTVYGSVKNPGKYDFRPGMTVSDIIMEAGGLLDGATLTNIEIARRGRVDKGFVKKLDVLAHPEDIGEVLMAQDGVFIRSEVNFRDPKIIYVQGEVSYPGSYAVDESVVRLSDIIKRAGDLTPDAYAKGATLSRWTTDIERKRIENAAALASQNFSMGEVKDSLDLVKQDYYSIGIDLEKAMSNPGSEADVILLTGDVVNVPVMNNTVKITGDVFYPNTVAFNKSYTWRDYVSQAGGMKKGRKKVYAVYMNGQVARKGSPSFKMEPGMEIVVASEKTERTRLSATELAAITSSTSTLAYMIIALVRML